MKIILVTSFPDKINFPCLLNYFPSYYLLFMSSRYLREGEMLKLNFNIKGRENGEEKGKTISL